MREATYPNEGVISTIAKKFIPLMLQCNFAQPTELMKKYHVRWTPTLLVLDADGKPRYHTVGFMPPDELVAHLALIFAMEKFDGGKLGDAIPQLRAIVEKHPKSSAAPQAVYYEWVAAYKKSHDARKLKQAYLELKERYPDSLWAKKAAPYADIPD